MGFYPSSAEYRSEVERAAVKEFLMYVEQCISPEFLAVFRMSCSQIMVTIEEY